MNKLDVILAFLILDTVVSLISILLIHARSTVEDDDTGTA